LLPVLLITPSAVAIIVFIYAFILFTLWTSFSRWSSPVMNLSLRDPAWMTYAQMFGTARWQCDLRNLVVFTIIFLVVAIGVGLLLALLLDRRLIGSDFFRNVFLFPYALSFIVTGVAWRWIFNPEAGVNLLFNAFGINKLLALCGAPPLKPGWITDPSVLFPINDILGKVFPAVNDLAVQLGIPVALIPVVIAASWQLSGFAMAMYIAGLSVVPHEFREAARIDVARVAGVHSDCHSTAETSYHKLGCHFGTYLAKNLRPGICHDRCRPGLCNGRPWGICLRTNV
jgi:glucose/mannose transport system permease protein